MSRVRKRNILVRPCDSAAARSNWERIFGSDEAIAARRKKAIAQQRRRHAAPKIDGLQIIPDTHKPFYSNALDCQISSRSQLKQTLAEHNARADGRRVHRLEQA